MFGTNLKATNSSFQKGMTMCRSICVKKVIMLLAFIFEQPSYGEHNANTYRKQYKSKSKDNMVIYQLPLIPTALLRVA